MTTAVQAANNLYVGGTGAADSGNCQSTPCATIGYAIGQASPDDVITLQEDLTEGMVVVTIHREIK